jgi:hypothetical protein
VALLNIHSQGETDPSAQPEPAYEFDQRMSVTEQPHATEPQYSGSRD